MEQQDNISQTRTPSWGAPAARSTPTNAQTQSISSQQNPFSNDQSYQHSHTPNSHRYQRSSPYHSDRGRNANTGNTYQNNIKQNDSPTFHTPGRNFNPRNPFSNKGPNFSSNNPFQSNGQNFSPSNPFQNKGQYSSPKHPALMQPTFQSSPPPHTPRNSNPSFSPRTPGSNYTPSPRNFGYQRGNSDSFKRYGQRNANMSNPGGSNNIKDYIHPSMLEDPWKDLPPTKLKSY